MGVHKICPACGAQFSAATCSNPLCPSAGKKVAVSLKSVSPSFHSAGVWGWFLRALLLVSIGLSVAASYHLVFALDQLRAARTYFHAEAVREQMDRLTPILRLESVILSVVTAIVGLAFLAWVYKSYRNLPALHATSLRFSPSIATIACMIPGVNLLAVYPVLIEIWRNSDPSGHPRCGRDVRGSSVWLVRIWYGLMIICLLLSAGFLWASAGSKTMLGTEVLENARFVQFVFLGISIPPGLLFFFVSWRIDRNQLQRNSIS